MLNVDQRQATIQSKIGIIFLFNHNMSAFSDPSHDFNQFSHGGLQTQSNLWFHVKSNTFCSYNIVGLTVDSLISILFHAVFLLIKTWWVHDPQCNSTADWSVGDLGVLCM